jgi:tetratricopeptide (TPR) repeat protein
VLPWVAVCAIVASFLLSPALAAAQDRTPSLESLDTQIQDLKEIVQLTLLPMAILASVLSIGGVLSVVFSVRDQRRVSQLHELAVTGESAGQRRTEQSFSTFLDESQKTLTLVNDTLALAKQASDRAAETMKQQTRSRIDDIEERAERLMLQVFDSRQFEAIVDNPHHLGELRTIAESLRAFEAYLSVQEIELPPYSRFVKAIDQFLRDDTDGALDELRRAAQERSTGDLHRFTVYWLGYMLTTIGQYRDAIGAFRDDEADLARGDSERLQLDRIVYDTRFFAKAKEWARDDETLEADAPDGRAATKRGPLERYEDVASLLDELRELAARVEASDDPHHRSHTSHEVARTRADIYTWIAYDPQSSYTKEDRERLSRASTAASPSNNGIMRADADDPEAAAAELEAAAFRKLADAEGPDAVRALALLRARGICEDQQDADLYVGFAQAECDFALGDLAAEGEYEDVEERLNDEFAKHREQRRTAELDAISLICHSRVLELLPAADARHRKSEVRHIRTAQRRALEAVREMRQPNVTVFSHVQRRNISQDEFRTEIESIVRGAHIDGRGTRGS